MRQLLVLAAFALFAVSCSSSDPSGPTPREILVAPDDSVALNQGDSIQLVASVLDRDGAQLTGFPVRFTSNNPALVSVSTIGLVRSLGPAGNASVRLKAGDIVLDVPVTVQAVGDSMAITPLTAHIDQLGSVQVTAQVIDRNGDVIPGASITYGSTNDQVATVSPTGLVQSVGPAGVVTIFANGGGAGASATITIDQVASGVTLVPDPLTLGQNSSAIMNGKVVDKVGAAMPGLVTIVSLNTSLVTISSNGVATSVGPLGSTSIIASSGAFADTVTATIVSLSHPAGNIADSVPITGNGFGVAISTNGVIYVTTLNGNVNRATLGNFNFTAPLTGLGQMTAIAFSPSGTEAYAPAEGSGLKFIDVATNSVTNTAGPFTGTPFAVALSLDGQTAYVGTDGYVYAVDVATHAVVDSVNLGLINHLAIHPSLNRLYATANNNTVYELDGATLNTLRSFPVGNGAQGVGVSPDGNTLYVASEGSVVNVVNLTSGAITPITGVCHAYGLLVTNDGQQVYISCFLNGNVQIIDTATRTVIKTFPFFGGVRRMAISPDGLSVVAVTEAGRAILIQ